MFQTYDLFCNRSTYVYRSHLAVVEFNLDHIYRSSIKRKYTQDDKYIMPSHLVFYKVQVYIEAGEQLGICIICSRTNSTTDFLIITRVLGTHTKWFFIRAPPIHSVITSPSIFSDLDRYSNRKKQSWEKKPHRHNHDKRQLIL